VPPCVPCSLRSPPPRRRAPPQGSPPPPPPPPPAPPPGFLDTTPHPASSKEKTYAKDSPPPHHEQEARAFSPSRRDRSRHLGEPERRRRDLLQRDLVPDVLGRRGYHERRFIRSR